MQPVTGYMDRLYASLDPMVSASAMAKKFMSALRLEPITSLRGKLVDALSRIYISALETFKKPNNIPDSVTNIISSGLAMLKSSHSQP